MTYYYGLGRAVDFVAPNYQESEEEKRIREANQVRYARRTKAAQMRKGEILARLRTLQEVEVLGAVVKLHMPNDFNSTFLECPGCSSGDYLRWPCETIHTILEETGVDTTDLDLIRWKGDL